MKQILLGEQLYMYERYKDITKLMLFDAVPYDNIGVMEDYSNFNILNENLCAAQGYVEYCEKFKRRPI